MKNKTLAAWLCFVGGPLGLHRFYLFGTADRLAWMLPIPSLLGLYGVYRARAIGLEDTASWLLIPLLGFTLAACALNTLVFGLMDCEKWNARFNPGAPADANAGKTTWLTIGALVAALSVGTTVLLASLAFSFQRYFEYQVDAAQALSQSAPQSTPVRKSAD